MLCSPLFALAVQSIEIKECLNAHLSGVEMKIGYGRKKKLVT